MSDWLKKRAVHAVRVGILACIVLLLRWQQNEMLRATASIALDASDVVELFAEARSLEPRNQDSLSVLNDAREEVGWVLQTSPGSDHIVGFSGPTNVLVGFSAADQVVGIKILSSGDTREHVQQVESSRPFMAALQGLNAEAASVHQYDAVSGATLTSLAICESISLRLGNQSMESLRFPDPPSLASVQVLFPEAATVARNEASQFVVHDKNGSQLGSLLRTSPAADTTIGYQGPTDTFVGVDLGDQVIGIAIGESFDNEPYVGYVREDSYFRSVFNGLETDSLAEFDLLENQVEGVSGATMTSMAVADGVVVAAKSRQASLLEMQNQTQQQAGFFARWTVHDWGTLVCIVLGSLVGMTRLRGNRRLGAIWNLVLIGYLGLIAGSLLSQAMFVGWARRGVPTKGGFGLICLAMAALAIPVATRRNLYCSHLCPHGAAQQLLKGRLPYQWKLTRRLRAFLRLVPALLLMWCIVVGMSGMAFSLVGIEPFDAWLFRVAGWGTVTVAIVGLVASLFSPMAYCRFGCPTGALLEFLRFNARSDLWTTRDWVATCGLGVAVLIWLMM